LSPAALRALADVAASLARLAAAAAEESSLDPSVLVPIGEAARMAATSSRVLRDAVRKGHLVAFGGQRDRSVRREDLDSWIESRRLRPVAGADDADIDRRVRRLERRRSA
jgi:hypothetical protein